MATIRLGPMAPPLCEQGVDDPRGILQHATDCINFLYVQHFITEVERGKAERRLVKRMKMKPKPAVIPAG